MPHPKHSFSALNLASAALSLSLLGVGACSGTAVSTPVIDAGPAADTSVGCRLSDGTFCAMGASCPSPDGCNVCSCTVGGAAICTQRACALDGGAAPDVLARCTLPNGLSCAAGATCQAGDDCNTCSCDASGTAVCTARPCAIDAGAPDVPPDRTCVIDCAAPPPGCHYEGVTSCDPPSCGTLVCADAGSEVTCGDGFPTFDRHCAAASDCFVATHQTNCCGDARAMGLNVSEREAFAHAEGVCQPMYPACGCAAHPPALDDGTSATFGGAIAVECRSGVCTTHGG